MIEISQDVIDRALRGLLGAWFVYSESTSAGQSVCKCQSTVGGSTIDYSRL